MNRLPLRFVSSRSRLFVAIEFTWQLHTVYLLLPNQNNALHPRQARRPVQSGACDSSAPQLRKGLPMTIENSSTLRSALAAVNLRADRFEPYLYALLRTVFAIVLFTHGLPKALRTSHGSMADPMAGSINLIQNVMGLPFAAQLAFLVMLLETVGALMLAVGLATRLVALLIAIQMLAISYALGPTWPWIDRGIEFPVLMGFLALYIVARGGGAHSVDTRLGAG
ncbi:putative oxidoreductase [Pseudomonas sp. NFACC09-4]|nr:putative oxidoreductase [Pseudomonas sp. NFACC09-4]SFX57702.1 putative oxidoreductase [Pseudomonas sp. NFACC36]